MAVGISQHDVTLGLMSLEVRHKKMMDPSFNVPASQGCILAHQYFAVYGICYSTMLRIYTTFGAHVKGSTVLIFHTLHVSPTEVLPAMADTDD